MKKSLVTTTIFLLFTYIGYCQLLTPQDKLALQIPQQQTYSTTGISSYVKNNFASDSERVRALFVWVANNINYDVEKVRLKKVQERTTVEDVLKTRMAICQGYAELLIALNKECNINSILVSGYTKQQNGSISELPHAWVAAEVNNNWYLFDPTWAAGTVKDFQFTRMFSNRFYKKLPDEMIKDHMPFDPMYQFLNYTLLYDEFNKGNT
ncbi:MAG TPA: transglutaminase domain-containing protein, partial [Segetibacter sp.]